MTLAHLLPTVRKLPASQDLLAELGELRAQVDVIDLPSSARAAVAAMVIDAHGRDALILVSRLLRARAFTNQLDEYLRPRFDVVTWPEPEALPFEQLPLDPESSARRVDILHRLSQPQNRPTVVVASVRGLLHLVMDPADLSSHSLSARVGERTSIDMVLRWAEQVGYSHAPLVQEPGTVAHRGGIVDIFPPHMESPVRLDFFGHEIESIRSFDASSQRSLTRLQSVTLLPPNELPLWNRAEAAAALSTIDASALREEVAAEWQRHLDQITSGAIPPSLDVFAPYFVSKNKTLADYLAPDSLLIEEEPSAVRLAQRGLLSQSLELHKNFISNRELPADLRSPIAEWSSVSRILRRLRRVGLGSDASGGRRPGAKGRTVSFAAVGDTPAYFGRLDQMVSDLRSRLDEGWSVLVATDQVERMTDIFEEHDLHARRDQRGRLTPPLPLEPRTLDVRAVEIDSGWQVPDLKLRVVTDLELFGFAKQRRPDTGKTRTQQVEYVSSLRDGEYVVHVDHGVARFSGLVQLETNGVEREYLMLEFAKGDKLYVPVDQSHRVARYSGGGAQPVLTRLGSGEWMKVKGRARRAVREMAFELIQLYAARETSPGHAFPTSTTWDHELADSFPFEETADQLRAINDVTGDMETARPMDRLITGDVGFGKTEIALRAAFKAVNAGRQVAVLVPTTILALQHFNTFRDRLAPFPVRIEMLSRLRGKSEQRQILADLADGGVDIVIGTHRLIQDDVRFKSLGLLIVDEEQRFGVRQKEFLKKARTEIDVMTMSATPIPRTMHMALAGIRDISSIDTAPLARMPIRTFVTAADDQLIREVVLRELDRGGQVYFVHNRVHDINRVAHRLRALIPEASIGVGHGQMEEHVLESVMLDFVAGNYDMLVATTIIESGVDIPNVNTIVIDDADTFGLTQLYQLRGRVGRSANRAYAYLLYRPNKVLSEDAQERLEAIQEATELGAGLRVAMKDLEIRGAGDLLGSEQSGHIASIGYDLYVRLLAQAVEEAKAGKPMSDVSLVTLDLPLNALIPPSYIRDTELRLNTYRRISSLNSLDQLGEMRDELVDRFGDIPEQVEHVFALVALRIRCQRLGIDSIVERERELVIRPVHTSQLHSDRARRELGKALRVLPNSIRIRLPDLQMSWQQALDLVMDAIEASVASAEATAA